MYNKYGMVSIARKNLFHDKGRLIITLFGLAVVLVMALAGTGMATGTLDGMTLIIDKSPADLWVLQDGNRDLMNPSVVSDTAVSKIKKTDGVAGVHRLIAGQAKAERNGRQFYVYVVGSDAGEAGKPWDLKSGTYASLREERTVILDESSRLELGSVEAGDKLDINGKRQMITGISRGAKSFIYPFAFTSLANARTLVSLRSDQTHYVLVDVERGADVDGVAGDISRIKGVQAFPAAAVRANTVDYMLYKSGMGVGIGIMTLIGIVVAAIIIALTVYTATMERIPEFGTLKAIGASRWDIYRILFGQVFLTASFGYLFGATLSFGLQFMFPSFTQMPVHITLNAVVYGYVATLALALLGSFVSIRRVNKVDPAVVFRG